MAAGEHSQVTQRSGERGVALVLVLLMAVILSLISGGLIFIAQTDTQISANYKYANEAFHAADAGVQRAVSWLNDSTQYTPHLPVTDYTTAAYPVQYANQNVILGGQTGTSSNYPDSTVANAFTAALHNQSLTADSNNAGAYSVNATLLKAASAKKMFGGLGSVERWRLDTAGFWGAGNSLATTRVAAIVENAASPYFDNALWGKDYVNLTGNASTDSYNPNLGAYGGSNIGQNGSIGTNGSVSLGGNGTVNGNAEYLPPGTCSGCTAGGNVTGSVTAITQPKPFPPIPAFTVGTTDVSGTQTINPGAYRNIAVGNHVTLTLNAGTYYVDSFTVSPNGTVNLNGPVTFYVNTTLSSGAGHYAVNAGGNPANFVIFYNGAADVSLTGQADFSAVVYSPNAGIKIAGNGAFYGSYIGKNIDMSGNGAVHYADTLQNDLMTLTPYHIISWMRGSF